MDTSNQLTTQRRGALPHPPELTSKQVEKTTEAQEKDFRLFIELGMVRDDFLLAMVREGADPDEAFNRWEACEDRANAEAQEDFDRIEADFQARRKAGFY